MKLVFVRHGDPDYRVDGLTEQGVKEAKQSTDGRTGERKSAPDERSTFHFIH